MPESPVSGRGQGRSRRRRGRAAPALSPAEHRATPNFTVASPLRGEGETRSHLHRVRDALLDEGGLPRFAEKGRLAHIFIASVTHFLTKEVFAAPASFLSAACPSQAVLSHLVMKLVLAAPASFLSVAWVAQASSAKASVGAPARQRARAASASVLVIELIYQYRARLPWPARP